MMPEDILELEKEETQIEEHDEETTLELPSGLLPMIIKNSGECSANDY